MSANAVAAVATSDRVLDKLRAADKFLLVTHEHPDGDALGSLIGLGGILGSLGKDSVLFLGPADVPLPYEYSFLATGDIVTEAPADLDERVVVYLDCGNIDRAPESAPRHVGTCLLNIDHHHDNTRFGDIDLVVPDASCTAEIVWELMGDLGVTPTPAVAEALYVGLVTDTGQFMYENTSPRAHAMAGDLIGHGVDVHGVYRHLYEGVPEAKVALLRRALERMRRFDDGRLTMSSLDAEDFRASGAEESYSEGIIDVMRTIRGTKVAALARERKDSKDVVLRKVSLRSSDGDVDVSAIARAAGGGGHRQAAGFTTDLTAVELADFIREQIVLQLG